jgi:eukaryotic-like serine/threonine-protein kinase
LKSRVWPWLLLTLAALKILGAVAGFASGQTLSPEVLRDSTLSPGLRCFMMLAFATVGLFLLISGRADDRAVDLGSFFFILATPFSNWQLKAMAESAPPGWVWPVLVLYEVQPDAFLAWSFWSFAQEFPNSVSSFRMQRLLLWGRPTALVAGVAGFAWQLGRLPVWLARHKTPPILPPPKPSYEYYGPLLLLTCLAFVVLVWRTRAASGEEGRRARLFVAALVVGLAPLFLQIVVELAIPPYKAFMDADGRRFAFARWVLFPCLISVLFTTTYAVVVGHLLNIRLIARKALQYALARYSAICLAVVPLVALAVYLYHHRDQSLLKIFSGPNLPLLGGAAAVGMAALRYRKTLLDAIDRHFFREQYDARQTLTMLVERIRATHGVLDLANLLCREADLALHPESVSLMAFEPRSGLLTDPKVRGRRLDASSALASLVASASEPLTVDLEDSRSPLAKLPEKDRYWLVDSGFRLIAPILARDGSLLGLIGLGEKKSGLPFFKEDRQLLRAIGSSAAWVLELEQSRSLGSSHKSWQEPVDREAVLSFPEPSAVAAELAKECPNCGRLYASYTVFCSHCSRRLEPSHVPYVLPGKFRFEKRIGIGGMGVVYRGTDLALGRPVAAKTLRRVSPEDAMRLRREARTAAAVSHPHLAPVYGMETWQGTPILVMELLEGGTLTQRIDNKRLEARETIELGLAMAEALEHLHASDILHRDIKPSNIGYTRDGIPKLMDFGIARVMFDLRGDTEIPSPDAPEDDSVLPPTSLWHHTPTSASMSKQLVGTLSYLSPEALNGQPADTSFDLWSLAIVLYECLLGRKIFSGGDIHQLMNRIRHGRVPEFAQVLPEHDALLGDFFRSALHRTINRRPASARELRERLAAVRLRLAA